TASDELKKLAREAAKQEKQKTDDFKKGATKGIWGYLTVVNNTGYRIYIYEDSRYLGYVNPYRTFTFNPPIRHGADYNTVLRGQSGNVRGGPQFIDYAVNNYTWTLTP